MSREGVLRAVYAVLERDEQLVTALNHVVGSTDPRLARIIGDDVRLSDGFIRPTVVLSIPAELPRDKGQRREVFADVFANDAMQLSVLLDHVERICEEYRSNFQPVPTIQLVKLEAGEDLVLNSEDPIYRVVAARMPIRAEYLGGMT